MKRKNSSKNNWLKRVETFNLKSWLKDNWLILIFLILPTLTIYATSLNNDFVSDDLYAIVNHPDLDQPQYFTSSFPIVWQPLFYFLINKFFGLQPMFFRSLNITLHLGNVLLSYFLISLLINSRTAAIASILLAIHPIAVESVAWISGGGYPQYTFFLLLALIAYLFSSQKKAKGKPYYLLSLLTFLMALTTSEKAAVLPIILLFFQLGFGKISKAYKKLIPYFSLSALWVMIYAIRIPERVKDLVGPGGSGYKLFNPLKQIPIAIFDYLRLIIYPQGLTHYHTELLHTYPEMVIRGAVILLLLIVIVWGFFKNRHLFFWLSFFFISLLPTLTPLGVSWVVAERYVYLGAIGIFVLIAIFLDKLMKQKRVRPWLNIFLALGVVALSITTVLRISDWKTQDSLVLSAAKTSPSSAQNHNNLGKIYKERDQVQKAIAEFKIAITLQPGFSHAYHNLGTVYQELNQIDLAIENFKAAVTYNPDLWQTHQNLAISYHQAGKVDLAEIHFKESVSLKPQNPDLHFNLAIFYSKTNRSKKAREELKTTLELKPDYLEAQRLLESLERQSQGG